MSVLKILFAISVMASGCGWHKFNSKPNDQGKDGAQALEGAAFGLVPTLNHFQNCDELQSFVHDVLLERRHRYLERRQTMAYDDAAASANGGAQASVAIETTNVQVAGVDEADMVKVSDDQIFVMRTGDLVVVDRSSLKRVGILDQDPALSVRQGTKTMYVQGRRLILLASTYENLVLSVYDLVPHDLPRLIKTREFNGSLQSSRLVAKRLILALTAQVPLAESTSQYVYDDMPVPARPVMVQDGAVGGVTCDAIIKSSFGTPDLYMTNVVSLSAEDGADDKALGVFGASTTMYMAESAMFITQPTPFDYHSGEAYQEKTVLVKVEFEGEGGDLAATAIGVVDGRVKDQWALNYYSAQQALAVATTSGQIWGRGEQAAKNHLFVLAQNGADLNIRAQVEDYGHSEDIRAVRYVGDMAYVVTFKKTDPLFAFSMKDPFSPQFLGELKVPGFSTYLHPVAPGRLFGVGFAADDRGDFAWFQGIQVSLFDTSDPRQLKQLDHKVLGERGSSSEITSDHHAFFFDEKTGLVAIPVVEFDGKNGALGGSYADQFKFAGTVFYKLGADSFDEVARMDMQDLCTVPAAKKNQPQFWTGGAEQNHSARRTILLDERILVVGECGLKAFDRNDLGRNVSSIGF